MDKILLFILFILSSGLSGNRNKLNPSGTVCWAAGADGKIGRLEFSSEETQ